MKHRFLVEVDADMTWTETRAFVEEAVSTWGGQYFPGNEEEDADPRFYIKAADVKVKRYVRPRPLTKAVAAPDKDTGASGTS